MINLKAAIVGLASILFIIWLLYTKIKRDSLKKKMMKMRKEKSRKKKI
ncbi:MAG: hypothetical protein ACXVH2_09010 [Methanobacterium sp.]